MLLEQTLTLASDALDGWSLTDLDFLFTENVGNLVCPASYDLGESHQLTALRSGVA